VRRLSIRIALLALAVAALQLNAAGQAPRFYSDDPLTVEPETQDASGARETDIDLFVDLSLNLFAKPGDNRDGVAAGNVNTIDEIPDSSWFTNRIVARPVSLAEAQRGSGIGNGVAPGKWTITSPKDIGAAPGFTMKDSAGETWFVSFDARGYPEAATGAVIVANKIFWTLGYWQTDTVLTSIRPEQIVIADTAMVKPMSGKKRKMRRSDLDDVLARAQRSPDGSYRAAAARRLPGKALGGFRYHGTRTDDPNDLIPHEHHRELRALQVFGAWTNLVDLKAGNTLDMLVTDGGRSLVRHYLQDVGSTFGTGANAPREYFEGWEYLYQGELVWKRFLSLGFFFQPWQTIPYDERGAIGRFEGDRFDPRAWKPRVPVGALRHVLADDEFWAARRVMAFSDEMIRGLVHTGGYSDPRDEQHLADVLIARRDKIGAAYLNAITPLVDFALTPAGELSFADAAVSAGVANAAGAGYQLVWENFNNATGAASRIGEGRASADRAAAPAALPSAAGSFVRIRITEVNAAAGHKPVDAYFRRMSSGWKLVGIDRGIATTTVHEEKRPSS
jgi:hypothetical protein